MTDPKYIRKVQTSVTNFIHYKDEYLFLKRSPHKKIDAGKLNATGGRVEPGEDFLQAVIRETKEETGYQIHPDQIRFCGLLKIEGGYEEDWVVGLFDIEVNNKQVEHNTETEEGTLLWIHKDQVLDSHFELVDDMNYYFKDLIAKKGTFFINAQMDEKEKVKSITISMLKTT